MDGHHSDAKGPERLRSRQDGFTLAEVIVASAVLLIILVPMSAALVSQSGLLTTNRAQVTAAHLAAGQLESDRTVADASSWSGSPPVPTLPSVTSPVTVAASSGASSISYRITRSVGWCMLPSGGSTWTTTAGASTIPSTAAVGYKDVVTVTWNGGQLQSGQVLQIPFTSIASPPTKAQTCPS